MSFFSDLLGGIAPIAAGFMIPGAPILAGAATGAGIAAMRGQDPLMGAVTGGFGGAGGAGLSGASGGLGAGAGAAGAVDYGTVSAGTQGMIPANIGSTEGLRGLTQNIPTAGAGTGITAGTRFSNMISNPGQTLANYGGGDKFKGAAKLGALGLPAFGQAMIPEYGTAPENPMAKYDPNRRLNLKNLHSGLRLNQPFAQFADGGYLRTGMGDGLSDEIPSSIDGEQPAALSENEFVVPADVVSHLGNGSSDAGAEQLYAMMDRIREARTGTEEQGREILAERFLPA